MQAPTSVKEGKHKWTREKMHKRSTLKCVTYKEGPHVRENGGTKANTPWDLDMGPQIRLPCLLWQEAYALSEPQREKTFMIHWYCYQHHVCNDWLLFVLWVWTAVAAVAASVVFAPSKYVILHCQVSTCCIATSIVWICDPRACSIISPCYVFWIWMCCGIMILWDFDFRRINAWI